MMRVMMNDYTLVAFTITEGHSVGYDSMKRAASLSETIHYLGVEVRWRRNASSNVGTFCATSGALMALNILD